MADGAGGVRRRREAPERIDYRHALEQVENFVDNELGNGRAPQPRPDVSEWRVQRAKTIRMLEEFRKKLDRICVGANYGKAAGNGAEALGASGSMIGALMCLLGLRSGQIVMDAGKLVHCAGTLIDGVSKVVESLISVEYLSEIEAVLKEDQELSRPLDQWLNYSRQLDANVQQLFGVSLASEKWNIVTKVLYEFSQLVSPAINFDATMRLMKQGRYSIYIGVDVEVERLQKFFQLLSTYPQFAGRIRLTLSVLSVSGKAIQGFIGVSKIYNYFMGTSSFSVTPTLRGGLNLEIPTAGEVKVFVFFQAIILANSVLSLINAASIIRHGTSKYSDALKQLTHALAGELRMMEDL